MALILCKKCGNSYSDLLSSDCPYCNPKDSEQQKSESTIVLPENLEIGKALPFWDVDSMCIGRFSNDFLTGTDYESYGFNYKKNITLSLHTHGLNITQGLTSFPINNAQIYLMHLAEERNRSTDKQEHVNLMIYFVESKTLRDRLIVVKCKSKDEVMAFLNRREYEMMSNEISKREPEHSHPSLLKLILIIGFIIALYLFFSMILKG
jgi:hypothetical protein